MIKKYNSMYFTKQDVDKGLHLDLLKSLYKTSIESENDTLDIHTYTEDDAVIIEWCQHSIEFDDNLTNVFRYVDYDEVIMLEKSFPDGHYEYFNDEEEYQSRFEEWLKEHTTYKQDAYGRWYDTSVYEDFYSSTEEKGVENDK